MLNDFCPPHAYVIETPKGATVTGVCRKCGDKHEWPSTLPEKWGIPVGMGATTRGGDVRNAKTIL